jgi:hypothetical protein
VEIAEKKTLKTKHGKILSSLQEAPQIIYRGLGEENQ